MKHLSILFTAILLSYSSFAQNSKFEIGLQAGPNLATFRYASSIVQSNRYPQVAGAAGLFVQYNLSNMFALRMDPTFERLADNTGEMDFTDQSGNTIWTGKIHFHYDYISIPILVRASMGDKIRFFANAGPNLGFLLNQSSISNFPDQNSKINNTNHYQTLNFGITGGIGVALPVKEKFSLSFELRDNFGLTNINTNTNYAIKTNAISLLVGFSYKLRKGTASKQPFTPTF